MAKVASKSVKISEPNIRIYKKLMLCFKYFSKTRLTSFNIKKWPNGNPGMR